MVLDLCGIDSGFRNEFVWIGLDVRRWETNRVSDTVSSDYVSGKGVAMTEELVCMVNIALQERLADERR